MSLASASAVKGSSVSLNLSLNAVGGAPAGLQWTLSYSPTNVTSLSAVAGPALTAAGKTLNCSAAAGILMCLASGMNNSTISSGVVAIVTATLSPASNSTYDSVPLSTPLGVLIDGTDVIVTGTGGGIVVVPGLSSLACVPTTFASGSSSTCTVTLSMPAPSGGTVVAISDNNGALTVPATVTVPASATTANFTATAGTVTTNQSVTVTASVNGTLATTVLTITAPTISALQCSPTTVASGGSSACTVTLSQIAPQGGSTVTLSSNNTALTVPASVTVAANSNTASFTTTAGTVTANQSVTLTGSLNGGSATALLTVTPPAVTVSTLQCVPATVISGGASSCTVTLSQAAPQGGATVALSSNNAALAVPASVTVAANATTATFTATSGTVTTNQTVTLTASLNGSSATATVTVTAPTVSTLQCTPTTVVSGGTSTCTITLSQIAPQGGSTVALSSNNAALTVPASVTVAANSNTATFTATAGTVTGNQSVTLTAALNGSSAIASLTVTPPAAKVSTLQCVPATVISGGASTCTVTLTQAAPQGGATVALSSNNAALTVPASVTVAANATTAAFTATAGTVTANQTVTLTASLNGSSATATVTVTAPTVSRLQCTPTTVVSGGTSTCTVTLSQNAPQGGSTVALSSNNAALTVPASATVAANSNTASFTATAGTVTGNQSVTLTASLNGSTATASVTVVPPTVTLSALQCSPATVISGGTSNCSVTLSQAAPQGGTTVSLSSNNAALTVPASVTVAANATTATFMATAGTVTTNQNVTLTASVNSSSATAYLTITAPTVSTLQCAPTTLVSGGTSSCTVTLSQTAPQGGSIVALSSNNTALTVPASVTVAANCSTASFTATAGTVTNNQSVTVTASLNGSTATASVSLLPSTGLVAAYAFDEGHGSTTADATGNGNTGQIMGATWTNNGKNGTALYYNSFNNYVDLGNAPMLQNTGSATWSAWVYLSGNTPNDSQIVSSSNDWAGWQLKTSHNTGRRSFAVTVSNSNSRIQRYSNTMPAFNTWYYVAGVYNATAKTLDIYVNGALDDGMLTGTVPSVQVLAPVDVTIGKRFGSGGYYFKGVIDNLRIYNQAISVAQIQNDMNNAVTNLNPKRPKVVTGAELPPSTQISDKATVPAALPVSLSPSAVSSLSCTPKIINAGSHATCELRVSANPAPSRILVTSTGPQVKTPAAVVARADQSSLTFQVTADAAARQQLVTVTASAGGAAVQDTIQVAAASQPILTVPDNQMAKFVTPMRFVVTAIDPAELPVELAASQIPAGASFDPRTGLFEWTPTAKQPGHYKITFTATNAARQAASSQVAIDVSSGQPALEAVERLCSPGGIASVTGAWLVDSNAAVSDSSGKAMNLLGTQLRVNGQSVPLVSVSPGRTQFVCPALAPQTPMEVVVETAAGLSEPLRTQMQSASPWVFPLDGSGQGIVSFAGTTYLAMPGNPAVSAHPAQPGDEIVIWATGLGLPAEVSAHSVSVMLGGVDTGIDSVTALPAHAGVYAVQVRVPVPIEFGDNVPVQVRVSAADGKQFKSNTVTIAVEEARQ